MRDNKGRFQKGHKETSEEKAKRIVSLIEAQRQAPSYLGDLKFSPLYNIWRSFMFTKKGKMAGYGKDWAVFKAFYNDMKDTYTKGLRLCRLDKDKPFNKDNCVWVTDQQLAFSRRDNLVFTYNGETKLLKEWSEIYGIPYNGLKQRFTKSKNYTPHEILFGITIRNNKAVKDINEVEAKYRRAKASKMISSYRCSDKKRNLYCDLDIDWFLQHISQKKCVYCGSDKKIGCDRIDNNIGHIKDNVIPCCYTCNVVRHSLFTVDEMRELGKTIKIIFDKRVLTIK